ncbi:hypothetical protein [Micromonospora psammae]|uniref:hypothetical protein n=1 Tax=Micromonospora sp. CPCC 205556 TaxID=3122398 RepID=UPI002FEF78E5
MSETDRPQPRDAGIAPAGVTDPLLWRLAVDVVDAHQPDATGRCDNLLCGHQEWPCDAARNGRRALELSGGAPEESAAPRRDDRRESLPGLPGRRPRPATEAA